MILTSLPVLFPQIDVGSRSLDQYVRPHAVLLTVDSFEAVLELVAYGTVKADDVFPPAVTVICLLPLVESDGADARFVAVVAVAALPEIEILHVPLAPPPVLVGA